MTVIVNHGGGCCGVRHMRNFGGGFSYPPGGRVEEETIKTLLGGFGTETSRRGKCIEAVITDTQFRIQPDLAQIMADNGFRIVSRFHNSSGGMCNVLHRVTGGRNIELASRRLPFLRTLMGK